VRLLLQRVRGARVVVDQAEVAAIGQGILLLVGIQPGDERLELDRVAKRVTCLRIFPDDRDRMNRSLEEVGGEILIVSQFTLCADTSKGRRPSFITAADPRIAGDLFVEFASAVERLGVPTKTGVFGAKMDVELTNDGPATFLLDVAPPDPVR